MTSVHEHVLRIAHIRRERHFPFRDYQKRHGCVFIHVPKTGGTSVLRALGYGRRGRDHLPWFVYQTANPEYYGRAFSFAFVRNPWDRAVSAYRYLKGGGSGREREADMRAIAAYDSFTAFVLEGLAEGHFRSHLLFLPQAYFVLGGSGEPEVDFVGRFERIEEDFRVVAERLGLPAGLPRENVGQAGGAGKGEQTGSARTGEQAGGVAYRAAYEDAAAADVIAEIYREDIRAFDYTF